MDEHCLNKISEEVFFVQNNFIVVNKKDLNFLQQKASNNQRKRSRLCTHIDASDPLHEMIIVHKKDNYIQPHKHINKSESFHMIEGTAKLFFFECMRDNTTRLSKL